MALGDRVKALREQRAMSRAKLAHDAGVSYAFVQQLETAVRKDPGVKNLGALAAVLGVSVDSLLNDPDAGIPSPEGSRSSRPLPSRAEIDELLDGLTADELVSARDLLRVWVGRVHTEVNQEM